MTFQLILSIFGVVVFLTTLFVLTRGDETDETPAAGDKTE